MKRKRTVEVLVSGLLTLSILTSCVNTPERQDYKYCYEITQGDFSEEEVAQIFGADTSYISCGFLDGKYVRTLVTKDKPIYLVPTENYLAWSEKSVKNLTDELNRIFEIINPDIKFIYQETMPEEKYNIITIDVADELDSTGVTYMQKYVKNGDEIYNFDCTIIINREYYAANFLVDLDCLLAHEVGHVLGLGHPDDNAEVRTVMSHYGISGANGYYTLNDMYLFATLYKAYSNSDEIYATKKLLDEYYESNTKNNFFINLFNPNNYSNSNSSENSNNTGKIEGGLLWPNSSWNNKPWNNNKSWKDRVYQNNLGLEK